jgi:hypothetical protein
MRIDYLGNVGIGTTGPKSQLQIDDRVSLFDLSNNLELTNNLYYSGGWKYLTSDEGAILEMEPDGDIIFYTVAAGTADAAATVNSRMIIKEGGNVGIGTTGPSAPLHIVRTESGGVPGLIIENSNADAGGDVIQFYKNSASPANGDSLGYFIFKGRDSDGNAQEYGSLVFNADDVTHTSEDASWHLLNWVAGTETEVLTIKTGNVGIGDTSPEINLKIGSGTFPIVSLPGVGIANGASAYSFFSASDNTHQWIAGMDGVGGLTYGKEGMVSNHDLAIITNNSGRIYIQAGGNVGIGTTSPYSPLSIYGTATGAPSGTHQTKEMMNLQSSSTADMSIGSQSGSPYGFWIQVRHYTNDNSYYPLLLNPLGGNVGIGTTDPTATLDVHGNVTIGASAYNNGNLNFWGDSATAIISATRSDNTLRGNLYFDGWGDFYFDNNLGVGADPGTYKLYVNGNGYVNGTLSGISTLTATTLSGDLSCTDCVNATEIEDIYVFNTSDTMSGSLGVGTDLTVSGGDLSITNNNGGIDFNDASAYWLKTATNWGIYWDTTNNILAFHGAGTDRANIDLDDGNIQLDGDLTVSGASTNFRNAILAVDGSGSGIDADLWDSYQFADYLNQAVKTTSTPQFARLGLGAAADATYLLNLNGALVHGTSTGVGIGTTSPQATLQVIGNIYNKDVMTNTATNFTQRNGTGDCSGYSVTTTRSVCNNAYDSCAIVVGYYIYNNTRSAGAAIKSVASCGDFESGHTFSIATHTAITGNANLDSATSYAKPTQTIGDGTRYYWGAMYAVNYYGMVTTISQFDLAEVYETDDATLSPGELVSVDKNASLKVKRAEGAYDNNLLGVVSTAPGVLLGAPEDYTLSVKVTLAGRVPTKVSTENGAIEVGDYLTSSSTPGVAMKATKSGLVIGRALEPFGQIDPSPLAKGDRVEVFINLGWYGGEVKLSSDGGVDEKVSVGNSLVPADFLTNLVDGLTQLGVSIKDGIITAVKLVVEEVQTKILRANVISISVEEGKDNVVGSATIPPDSMEYQVKNSLVQANSKIFVSFTSNTAGRTWYVSEKTPGTGFTIRLSEVTTELLSFDYWILLVEGQPASSSDQSVQPPIEEPVASSSEPLQPSAEGEGQALVEPSTPAEVTASVSEPPAETPTESGIQAGPPNSESVGGELQPEPIASPSVQ